MALPLLLLALLVLCPSFGHSQRSPSPGYYPSSQVPTSPFDRQFQSLWGSQHQRREQDVVTIWLDKSTGSGFKSLRSYTSGYFGASIKVQSGFTAGVDTSLYLSNNQEHPGDHDEVDIEFLGTTPGKPYSLQTNVFARGSGDRNDVIGREMKFNLWFDPTQDFHHYAILWNPNQIVFFVDDVPIRTYNRKNEATFPTRPMWVYGSIWDASDWATENGRIKADYRYQPFVAKYKNFKLAGCTDGSTSCRPPSPAPFGYRGLTRQQMEAMAWAQRNFLVYNYCHDPKRDHTQIPEC